VARTRARLRDDVGPLAEQRLSRRRFTSSRRRRSLAASRAERRGKIRLDQSHRLISIIAASLRAHYCAAAAASGRGCCGQRKSMAGDEDDTDAQRKKKNAAPKKAQPIHLRSDANHLEVNRRSLPSCDFLGQFAEGAWQWLAELPRCLRVSRLPMISVSVSDNVMVSVVYGCTAAWHEHVVGSVVFHRRLAGWPVQNLIKWYQRASHQLRRRDSSDRDGQSSALGYAVPSPQCFRPAAAGDLAAAAANQFSCSNRFFRSVLHRCKAVSARDRSSSSPSVSFLHAARAS
jgi:hypothetical protein